MHEKKEGKERERFVYILNVCFMASITLEEKKLLREMKKTNFLKRLESGGDLINEKLSNKISFYYPFIKFIEDIDLTTNIKKGGGRRRRGGGGEGTKYTSNPLAWSFFFAFARERWTINTEML